MKKILTATVHTGSNGYTHEINVATDWKSWVRHKIRDMMPVVRDVMIHESDVYPAP